MNGGAKPQILLPVYDAQELRRRVPVCFTIGELFKLAERLGVPQTPAWSNNPQEASRDIVRHFERSGALAFLVEALREAKPLVEWPEPLPVPAAPPAAPAANAAVTVFAAPSGQALEFADTSVAGADERVTPVGEAPAADLLASAQPSLLPSQPPPGGFAPARMPKPGEAPPFAPQAPLPPAPMSLAEARAQLLPQGPIQPQPSSRAAPLSTPTAWPATARPAPARPEKKGLDPRLLLGGAAAFLIAAVAIAFFVGRASSRAATASTTGSTGLPPDQAPIAQLAAGALGVSLERVAQSCQIDPATLHGRSLFEVAYRRCGVPLPTTPATQPRTPSLDPDPDPGADSDPAPANGKRPKTSGNKLQRADTIPQTSGATGTTCLSRCAKSHNECTSRCGAEPKQSSLYDAYQGCLSGCLKAASQCKMGCPN